MYLEHIQVEASLHDALNKWLRIVLTHAFNKFASTSDHQRMKTQSADLPILC